MANSNTASPDKVSLSADIVVAFVTHNSVPPGGLPLHTLPRRYHQIPVYDQICHTKPMGSAI
jgi:hypothetical protein